MKTKTMDERDFLKDLHQRSEIAPHHHTPDHVLNYLKERGVSEENLEKFEIGYIPRSFHWEGSYGQFSDTFQRWTYSDGSNLLGKLFFPLRNPSGHLLGGLLRNPSKESRGYARYYLPSADAESIFFGINHTVKDIWRADRAFLCEGIFDFFPLRRVVDPVLCLLTASVSQNQLTFLKRFVSEVYFLVDQDEQGETSFYKFRRNHRSSFDHIARIQYPSEDIGDLWREKTKNEFEDTLESRIPVFETV